MIKLERIFIYITIISTLAFKAMDTIEYLSVPGPILFEKDTFLLKWSASNKNYYKQEYIRNNDTLEKFNKMVFIEVLLDSITTKEAVAAKIKELEERKKSDPVANYQILDNKKTGEYLLDFLISKGDLYEWNAYRYKTINTNKGKAVMLFAYCFRSFEGGDLSLDGFFPYLKENRNLLIGRVANHKLPDIKIKQ